MHCVFNKVYTQLRVAAESFIQSAAKKASFSPHVVERPLFFLVSHSKHNSYSAVLSLVYYQPQSEFF